MIKTILVAGATGNLGGKIIDELLKLGVHVRAVVREQTLPEKIANLESKGVKVFVADMLNKKELSKICMGCHCVVSALSGLKEVIIDVQKVLLDAAVDAGVLKFIPSDFAIDFTNLVPGKNRNLDLRRDFHTYLDKANIKATTIFNGPFMEFLIGDMPLILFKKQRILCWGNKNEIMDFTTTLNIATYTALAAVDNETPRYLRIAGDRLSCNEFVHLMTNLTGEKYKILKPGDIGLFNFMIKLTKFFSPGSNELYPAWQGMQYMRDMMEGRVKINDYNNNRYTNINWTSIKEYLEKNVNK